ncbi:MAG TPA: delta-60 repeat domain-containing protein [Bacteroidales bacterium]|nr:delta-60 repeat domain-containing protein [Bacteroidales bacterium]
MSKKYLKYNDALLTYNSNLLQYEEEEATTATYHLGYPSGFQTRINSILIDPYNPDHVYIAGNFSHFGGWDSAYGTTNHFNIVHLGTNGQHDTKVSGSLIPSNQSIQRIRYESSEDKIYVTGSFTVFGGATCYRIGRLQSLNTSPIVVDVSFSTNIANNINNVVYDSILDKDGKIYIGGIFTSGYGVTCNRILRINNDGTYDSSMGTGFDSTVYTFEKDPSNRIYIGGTFTTYQGSTYNRILRLNDDGTVDTTFNSGGGSFNNAVYKILYDPSIDKLYIGGDFTTYNGNSYNRILRLNMDGTVDTAFNCAGLPASIQDMCFDSQKNILVAGRFHTTLGGELSRSIVKFLPDGTVDTNFYTNGGGCGGEGSAAGAAAGSGYAVACDYQDRVYVGGVIRNYKFEPYVYPGIIRLKADGSNDTMPDEVDWV